MPAIEKKGSLDDRELHLIVNLLNHVWPKSNLYNFEYLDWLYRKNPNGLAESFNLWDKDKIVGHYAAIPITSNILSEKRKGLLSLNTAIHEDYRGKNYFTSLAKNTYEEAKKSGVTFVIGVANAISTLLFQRYLKFKKIGPLDVKIGLGLPRRKYKDFDFDYFAIRDEALIAWRLKNPQKEYFFKEESDGISVWTNTYNYNIFVEMLWMPKGNSNEYTYIKENLKAIKGTKNPFNLSIGLDSRFYYPFYKHLDVPNKFKPSPLNLIFLDLARNDLELSKSKIQFSAFDFDAY